MDELLRKRMRSKTKLQRIGTFSEQLDEGVTAADIHIRLDMLSELWIEFDTIQTQIECVCSDADLSKEQREQDEFEAKFCTTKARLLNSSQIKSRDLAPPNQTANPMPAQTTSDAPGQHQSHIKLPAIQLPTFSGEYQQWASFSDLFRSVIHDNSSLSSVQKLHYLKASMRGEAARVLSSVAITQANYEEAWKILKDRFSNKRQIIQSHLKSLYAQPRLNSETPKDIRRLLDTTIENLRALHALGLPTDQWDHLITFLVTERLDGITRKQWELMVADEEHTTFESLKQFLERRCRALEASTGDKRQVVVTVKTQEASNKGRSSANVYQATSITCIKCNSGHPLFMCDKFLQLPVNDRMELVRKSSLCYNCLRNGHASRDCKSSTCKKCHKFHNTLLHRDSDVANPGASTASGIVATHARKNEQPQVLLATAKVDIIDNNGQRHTVRALLDSGSQATFIAEAVITRLKLPRTRSNMSITGLGATGLGSTKGAVQLEMSSLCGSFKSHVHAFILKRVTDMMPLHPIDQSILSHTIVAHNLKLADPDYNTPGHIDILIGADLYYELLLAEKIKDHKSKLILQNTVLGWIIAGPIQSTINSTTITSHLLVQDLSTQLQQFWELEEMPSIKHHTPEEIHCEEHFTSSYTRTATGRFMVQLPFNDNVTRLGDTKVLARHRLLQQESRFKANPEHEQEYATFMKEYCDLGHMELITTPDSCNQPYYLPHHYVLREGATSTKLRVVFDGSARPAIGSSLNEALRTGPTIQENLLSTITRFRMHNIVYTADIEKMYRQVLVHPDHRKYQHILWRPTTHQSIQEYRLNTLTYGTTSAPFLAVRCLTELATSEQTNYLLAAPVVLKDFYVDDVMSGSDSVEEAHQTQVQLIEMLKSGGFRLHKWNSNSKVLMSQIPEHLHSHMDSVVLKQDPVKTLGIYWHSQHDDFRFQVEEGTSGTPSKRSILSQTSKIFDPLGWLAPIIIRAKILMQRLWLLSISWDDELPQDIVDEWNSYRNELPHISQIRIPRQLTWDSQIKMYQLHGFSDASEAAYGAAIYLRSPCMKDFQVQLVCAKSKVAPLKLISLPRLELCGALLLSRLLTMAKSLISPMDEIFAWTDSTIVLSWMNKQPHHWKPFVANRVAEIQALIPPHHWRHVVSSHNPADCLTRGFSPTQLQKSSLWWNGPPWLRSNQEEWPVFKYLQDTISLEAKSSSGAQKMTCFGVPHIEQALIAKCSSFSKLIRITAYCLRFISNCTLERQSRNFSWLSTAELSKAELLWIRTAQCEAFDYELQRCKKGKEQKKGSTLNSLAPFIDNNGVMRVGGRLQEAPIPYDQRHPIVMPHTHQLTNLIVQHYHLKHLHAGPQLLLAILRTKFWIIRAKSLIRQLVHNCMACFRHRVVTAKQLMGNLPQPRLEPARPFVRCGIDYAGPITIKTHKGRGNIKTMKSYICIFICFASRAVHIELVGDLTTQAFVAALRRFVSRRGKPSHIHSDCGTNFIGANRELKELHRLITSPDHNAKMSRAMTDHGIEWHFNPPSAPHFGGLWEAGVKSTKYHLRRTIGMTVLTFEELYTLLTQIEACLNSRPICPMSNEPEDLQVLTPGHFLIGESLVAIPDQGANQLNVSNLTRWQLIQNILHQFWRRWVLEYCTRLQQRPKWTSVTPNLEVGSLILLKEDNTPPLQWPMARIVDVHPGQDALVRTVTVKTKMGVIKRPISKCCLLPMQNHQEQFGSSQLT